MKRKIISVILAIALVLPLLLAIPLPSFAEAVGYTVPSEIKFWNSLGEEVTPENGKVKVYADGSVSFPAAYNPTGFYFKKELSNNFTVEFEVLPSAASSSTVSFFAVNPEEEINADSGLVLHFSDLKGVTYDYKKPNGEILGTGDLNVSFKQRENGYNKVRITVVNNTAYVYINETLVNFAMKISLGSRYLAFGHSAMGGGVSNEENALRIRNFKIKDGDYEKVCFGNESFMSSDFTLVGSGNDSKVYYDDNGLIYLPVITNHTGFAYKTPLSGNYTIEADVKIPAEGVSGAPFITLGDKLPTSWIDAYGSNCILLRFRNWSDAYGYFLYENAVGGVSQTALGFGGTYNLNAAGYNHFKIVVQDGVATTFLNGLDIGHSAQLTSEQNYLYFAFVMEGAETTPENSSQIKNLKITANGTTKIYNSDAIASANKNWNTAAYGDAHHFEITPEGYLQLSAHELSSAIASSKQGFVFNKTTPLSFDLSIPYPHDELLGATQTDGWGNQFFGITLAAGNTISYVAGTSAPSVTSYKTNAALKTLQMKICTEGTGYRVFFYVNKHTSGDVNEEICLTPEGIRNGALIAPNKNVTITYELTENDVEIYVTPENGNKTLFYTAENISKAFEVSNEVGVAFAASSYGAARTEAFLVKAVNGVTTAYAKGTEFTGLLNLIEATGNDFEGQPFYNWGIYTDYTHEGIKLAGHPALYTSGGIALRNKTNLANASATLKINDLSENAFVSISFSKTPLTETSDRFWEGQILPDMPTNEAFTFRIFKDGAADILCGWDGSYFPLDTIDASSEIEFALSDIITENGESYVYLTVNGKKVKKSGEDLKFRVSNVLDENKQCYMGVALSSNGINLAVDIDVLALNGNVFTYELPEDDIYLPNRPTIIGAQYRLEGTPGLRFSTRINVTKNNATEEWINGKITIHEDFTVTIGNIKRTGTLIMPADMLGNNDLRITEDGTINGTRYLNVEMKKLYRIFTAAHEEGYVIFNAVMVGIPDSQYGGKNYDRQFVAVSYIEYEDGSIIYSKPLSRSIADVHENATDNEADVGDFEEWWDIFKDNDGDSSSFEEWWDTFKDNDGDTSNMEEWWNPIPRQSLEAVVMVGNEWNQLRFKDITNGTLVIKNVSGNTTYVEGVDYEVDYENGKIRRLANSKIPDFSESLTYGLGVKQLDDKTLTAADMPKYYGYYFTVYAEYEYNKDVNVGYDTVLENINNFNGTSIPENVINKVKNGQDITIGVIGDSISTGAEATKGNEYFTLLANYLRNLSGNKINVDIVNVSVGGHTSDEGITRANLLYQECGDKEPDLVIIAYGMNDQNSTGDTPYNSPEKYASNIAGIVNTVRNLAVNDPDIILVTSMPSNPQWLHTSGKWYELGDALRAYAKQENIPLADVGAFFQNQLDNGQTYEELIYSMINHPGDYGHKLYFLTLKSLFN